MNSYKKLRDIQQKRVDDFPMYYAFSDEQFKEVLKQLNLTEKDLDQLCKLPFGGFILKKDAKAYVDLFTTINKEREEAIAADLTGEKYIADMFEYELNNHEYAYVWDSEPALDALGLTLEETLADPRLKRGFELAKSRIREWDLKNN